MPLPHAVPKASPCKHSTLDDKDEEWPTAAIADLGVHHHTHCRPDKVHERLPNLENTLFKDVGGEWKDCQRHITDWADKFSWAYITDPRYGSLIARCEHCKRLLHAHWDCDSSSVELEAARESILCFFRMAPQDQGMSQGQRDQG